MIKHLRRSGLPSAFTLLEIVIVVAIIGILAAVAVMALNSARIKARDSKRINDIVKIQAALELYDGDTGSYPAFLIPGKPLLRNNSGKQYLPIVPHNIMPADGNCPDGFEYNYTRTCDGAGYILTYCLGASSGQIRSGINYAVPGNFSGDYSLPGNTGSNFQPECDACSCGDCSQLSCGDTDFEPNGSCAVIDTVYRAVKIGDQCWLDKNINLGSMKTDYGDMVDDSKIEKWCGCDGANCSTPSEDHCRQNGGLYSWAEAMYLPNMCNVAGPGNLKAGDPCYPTSYLTGAGIEAKRQGICPKGWHVPSDYEENVGEFYVIKNYLPDSNASLGQVIYADTLTNGYAGSVQGSHLLKPGGRSGLNFFLSGQRKADQSGGHFEGYNQVAYTYVSSIQNNHSAYRVRINSSNDIDHNATGKRDGYGVRCLKD